MIVVSVGDVATILFPAPHITMMVLWAAQESAIWFIWDDGGKLTSVPL